MKIRTVSHIRKEDGKYLGTELQIKPVWFWPFWQKVYNGKLYTDDDSLNRDMLFAFSSFGYISNKYSYD